MPQFLQKTKSLFTLSTVRENPPTPRPSPTVQQIDRLLDEIDDIIDAVDRLPRIHRTTPSPFLKQLLDIADDRNTRYLNAFLLDF